MAVRVTREAIIEINARADTSLAVVNLYLGVYSAEATLIVPR